MKRANTGQEGESLGTLQRTLLLSVLLLTSAVTAGCLGDGSTPAEPAGTSNPEPSSSTSGASWNLTLSGTAEYLLAYGRPFGPRQDIAVVAGCGTYGFEMPDGTTQAEFTVSGPPVNESRPGAGYQSFRVKHDDHETYQVPPENDLPREQRTIEVTDPDPGEWFVWVWPWGPTVNQAFDIEVLLTGTGPGPQEAPSLVGVGFCAEDGATSSPIGAGP